MENILNTDNLSFSWGNNEVLKGINLSVRSNEILAILGVNGAGKSTLIKCLNGILKLDHGKIEISGKDTSEMNLIEISKLMSYVPQSVRTSFSVDVFDVVLLGRRPHISWRISDEDREIVSKTIRMFDLEDFAFRKFDQLSGGERQRVVIAKAVAQDSQIFLFDEPTSDLDLKNQIEVMQKIKDITSNITDNKSAIIAIHDINIAARFADRIMLLHDGYIFALGNPAEVLTKNNIAEVFGVTCDVIPSTEDSPMRIIVKEGIKSN